MINVGSNYQYINSLISKNNGVFISIAEYEKYGYEASKEMFDDFMGIKTTPRISLGKNRLVDSRLLPYKKKVNLSFASEVLTKPTDCRYISAVYTRPGKIPVKPLDDDRQAMIMADPLASPNDQDKYYIEGFTELTLLGEEALNVTVEYYERPKPVVYAYTPGVGGRPVYNDAGSTHYAWDASEEPELTSRILAKVGLSMKDQIELQVAQNTKNQE